MDEIESSTRGEPSKWRLLLERLRLRFRDAALESAYRADRFRHDLGNIRFAFLAGIALWITWGVLLRPHMLALSDQRLDMLMRFGVFIPMLIFGLVLTFTRFFGRIWEWVFARDRIGDAPVLGVLRLACVDVCPWSTDTSASS